MTETHLKAAYIGFSVLLAVSSIDCTPIKKGKNSRGENQNIPAVVVTPPVEVTPLLQESNLPQIEIAPLPIIGEQVKRVATGDILRTLEEQSGKAKLTFQEAQRIVSLTTRLYEESTGSIIISGDINKQVFILEGMNRERISREEAEKMTRAELEQTPFMQKLRSNYRAAIWSDSVLRRVATSGRANGFVEDDYVFINLDAANGESVTTPIYPYFPKDQFLDIGIEVNCSPLGPASSLRSTLLHELFHRDTEKSRLPVDPDFIPVFQTAKGWLAPVEPKEQYGFGIVGNLDGHIYPVELFEEMGADYTAARIGVVNGLGYKSNDYSNPKVLYNLGQVLAQARIDDMTMLDLHRRGQLKEFMLRIGRSARAKIDHPLVFAFDLARGDITNIDTFSHNSPWKAVQEYFPTVTNSKYSCK